MPEFKVRIRKGDLEPAKVALDGAGIECKSIVSRGEYGVVGDWSLIATVDAQTAGNAQARVREILHGVGEYIVELA